MVSPDKPNQTWKRILTPMAKITSLRVTEQFEHFVRDLRENFWRDVYGQTRLAWKGAQLDRQGASESRPVESGQVKSGLMSDDAGQLQAYAAILIEYAKSKNSKLRANLERQEQN